MLLAAGAVYFEQWLAILEASRARFFRRLTWGMLAGGFILVATISLPLAPVGSAWFNLASGLNETLVERIG